MVFKSLIMNEPCSFGYYWIEFLSWRHGAFNKMETKPSFFLVLERLGSHAAWLQDAGSRDVAGNSYAYCFVAQENASTDAKEQLKSGFRFPLLVFIFQRTAFTFPAFIYIETEMLTPKSAATDKHWDHFSGINQNNKGSLLVLSPK